jgi:hypothetical protein
MRKLVLAAAIALSAQALTAQAGQCDEYWRMRHNGFYRPAYSTAYANPYWGNNRRFRHEERRMDRRMFRNEVGYRGRRWY